MGNANASVSSMKKLVEANAEHKPTSSKRKDGSGQSRIEVQKFTAVLQLGVSISL